MAEVSRYRISTHALLAAQLQHSMLHSHAPRLDVGHDAAQVLLGLLPVLLWPRVQAAELAVGRDAREAAREVRGRRVEAQQRAAEQALGRGGDM